MDCNCCGGKMVKLKYLKLDELSDYLVKPFVENTIEDYSEWLRSLDENDVVLTLFERIEFQKKRQKYYVRIVEKKTKNGLKLKKLSKIFKYDTGTLVYGKDEGMFSIKTIYKILPVDEVINREINEYCTNTEEFDIDKLNKMITNKIIGCKRIEV